MRDFDGPEVNRSRWFRAEAAARPIVLVVVGCLASGCSGLGELLEPKQQCGNGALEGDEECDDRNTLNGDGCSSNCKLEGKEVQLCGNGSMDPGEECDDGNNESGDGCSATCESETPKLCGNGVVDDGEECDDGEDTADCNADCTVAECGDGYLNSAAGEECDDGNTFSGDGCTPLCVIGCVDLDGDGKSGKDAEKCPYGEDYCDLDQNNWTLAGCTDCVDGDGDGYGEGCDLGSDCDDSDDTIWNGCNGLLWLAIPGGVFDMGSGASDEQPIHTVNVPSFELLKTEVTAAQYAACVSAGACSTPGTGSSCHWNQAGYENHPINCVQWQQAVDFCEWIGGRLPTEAEFEYAARSGGQAITYPWGDEEATCQYAVMSDGGWGCGTGGGLPVCSKPDGNSDQGVCDLSGNVWEWIQDWYHQSYEGAPTDGSAWVTPATSERSARGGAFDNNAGDQRASNREQHDPQAQNNHFLGFRCAR